MALLEILEPKHKFKSQELAKPQGKVIGIDLGTTHSLVATIENNEVVIIKDEFGNELLPSCIHVMENGQKLVGYLALKYLISDAFNTLFSIKRFMGKGLSDFDVKTDVLLTEEDGQLKIKTQRGSFYPVELSSEILSALKQRAESYLKEPILGAVITVPAYFDDAQRFATKQAAEIAGLKVLRLINEPTAAAIAYGLESKVSKVTCVYDFGGGTFDISLLNMQQGLFEVLATKGDTALGGDDIDIIISNWIVGQVYGDSILDKGHSLWRYVLSLAKDIKHQLNDGSDPQSVKVDFDFEGTTWNGSIRMEEFNRLIEPIVDRTLHICQKALNDANLDIADIEQVVLVGGSTRLHLVVEKVQTFFKRKPLKSLSVDSVVAMGAALQADLLSGHSQRDKVLLLDVNPLSLGLETMGGLVEKIIPRNSRLPISKTQSFTTYQDGQSAISLHVLQGEREKVEDNRSLAKFLLKGLPDVPAQIPKVDVTFSLDIDGLLTVSATEKRFNIQSTLEIKPTYGLSDESIYHQIRDAIENASSDIQARKLRERQFEAEQLIKVIENGLVEDKSLLSESEFYELDAAMHELKCALQDTNTKDIYQKTQNLEKVSQPFIERRLNKGLNLYLREKKI